MTRPERWYAVLCFGALALLWGCLPETDPLETLQCSDNTACTAGRVCIGGYCQAPELADDPPETCESLPGGCNGPTDAGMMDTDHPEDVFTPTDTFPPVFADTTDADGDDGDSETCGGADCGGPMPIAPVGTSIVISGSLDEGDPVWNRPTEHCMPGDGMAYLVKSFTVINESPLPAALQIKALWSSEGSLHVFETPFEPHTAQGCIMGDHFTEPTLSRIDHVGIGPGQMLEVVVSSLLPMAPIGHFELEVATLQEHSEHICTDGIDDDADGATDCQDPDCWHAPSCQNQLCPQAIPISFDETLSGITQGPTGNYSGSCGGIGAEALFSFSSPVPTVVCARSYYRTVYVRSQCEDTPSEVTCGVPTGLTGETRVQFDAVASETYTIFVDSELQDSMEEWYDLTLHSGYCGEVDCQDGQDEDNNGATDCDDPVCVGTPACTELNCDDGEDNDEDGATDCADTDCMLMPFCTEHLCDDSEDNDNDGATDCNDPDCIWRGQCGDIAIPIAQEGKGFVISDRLGEGDPRWYRPEFDCGQRPEEGLHFYDALRVVNNTGAPQTLRLSALWAGDGMIFVFADPFDPNDSTGCITGNDDYIDISQSLLEGVIIDPGQVLSIVSTTYTPEESLPNYTLKIATESQP